MRGELVYLAWSFVRSFTHSRYDGQLAAGTSCAPGTVAGSVKEVASPGASCPTGVGGQD